MDLSVVIIEDDPRYRSSLETLFTHAPGFSLGASFGSPRRALDEVDRLIETGEHPVWKLVLMDLELPGISGIQATKELKAKLPDLAIVVLTVFEDPTTIVEAILAGADGYLLKKTPAAELLSQLRMIASEGAPLTAGVARTLLELVRQSRPSVSPEGSGSPTRLDLTNREQEVLQGLVRGLSYKQVADHLEMSVETVRTHIRAIYKKLHVHSAAEAVARALREKLV
ncbi:MAG: response regulator transcription factor [Acidobacteriota bacterium]